MTEAEWLASNDPAAMLAKIQSVRLSYEKRNREPVPNWQVSDRKLRLFACACCRAVFHLLTDERSRRAVEVAERYADGLAAAEEVRQAHHDLLGVAGGNSTIAWALSEVGLDLGNTLSWWLPRPEAGSPASQAALLRDIIGNPWRPVTLPGALPKRHCFSCGAPMAMEANHHHGLGLWRCSKDSQHVTRAVTLEEMNLHRRGGCPWLTPTVLALAEAAYAERRGDGSLDPDRLAVLADALEDAGCAADHPCDRCGGTGGRMLQATDKVRSAPGECPKCAATGRVPSPIIGHLRGPGPHIRGCWCVDLILGKA